MALSNLNEFLTTFFQAYGCVVKRKEEDVFSVQLTKEMDKILMNRPFYWHYMEKMGKVGQPMRLQWTTNPKKRSKESEWIHFGNPWVQQIIHFIERNEKYTRLYERISSTENTPLYPWLITNIKIAYIGKQIKEELFSIGLNLVNGVMQAQMMNTLKNVPLQITIPNYCYTISPLIMPVSGYTRIENIMKQYIQDQKHQWAKQSLETLNHELKLLYHFYDKDDIAEEESELRKEKEELMNRYYPKIKLEVINGGIFYLASDPHIEK